MELSESWTASSYVREVCVAPRQFSADRVRFFSDGVFAVLITILGLELEPPHADRVQSPAPALANGF